jgi:CRP-like cAMP-binding protein
VLMRTSDKGIDSPNQFLRSLGDADRARLAAKLRRVSVEPGRLLSSGDDTRAILYFPETVIVSIESDAGGGQHIETAVIGYEGMVGWSGLLGSGRLPQRAIVQMRSGTLLGISIDDMAVACEASRTLFSALLCFIEIVMAQMSRAIASHLHDRLDRRVCRWLLMRHDRVPIDQLSIKHDEISRNLGTRRASVTDCLHVLEGQRLIRCYRGRIIVRDRAGLEQLAGHSYGLAEADYRTLIGPFGRSRDYGGTPNRTMDFQHTAPAMAHKCVIVS